jgi:hypothetical protein
MPGARTSSLTKLNFYLSDSNDIRCRFHTSSIVECLSTAHSRSDQLSGQLSEAATRLQPRLRNCPGDCFSSAQARRISRPDKLAACAPEIVSACRTAETKSEWQLLCKPEVA